MSYILDEALSVLKEAYSDSLPKWFRTRLQSQSPDSIMGKLMSATRNLSNAEAEKDLYPDKYEKAKNRVDSLNRKYGDAFKQKSPTYGSRYSGETNLVNLLKAAGYDPSSFSVVEMAVPESMQDDIFSNPDALPVFHIVSNYDDKVWVQGINDNEKFFDDDNKEQAFKYMNNVKLKKYVKDFAYIDLAAPETHQSDSTLSRDKSQGILYSGDPINYTTRWGEIKHLSNPELETRRFTDRDRAGFDKNLFDKSGYFRGDVEGKLSSRLKEQLKKVQNKKIPKRVLDLEKQILSLQSQLTQYLSQSFDYSELKGVDVYNFGREQKNIIQTFGSLISYWKTTQQYLESDLQEDPNRDSFSDVVESYLRSTINVFNDLSQALDKYKTTYFTW